MIMMGESIRHIRVNDHLYNPEESYAHDSEKDMDSKLAAKDLLVYCCACI